MTDDLFNEFMGYDFTMGADVMKCPHCVGVVEAGLGLRLHITQRPDSSS